MTADADAGKRHGARPCTRAMRRAGEHTGFLPVTGAVDLPPTLFGR